MARLTLSARKSIMPQQRNMTWRGGRNFSFLNTTWRDGKNRVLQTAFCVLETD